ncbi:MAG: hypothetical protein LBH47_01925 [Christensenellaceae bacterium]|jgi:hypothetical protein|nr:hypothetical protein [Christensenellaceae bacterium]
MEGYGGLIIAIVMLLAVVLMFFIADKMINKKKEAKTLPNDKQDKVQVDPPAVSLQSGEGNFEITKSLADDISRLVKTEDNGNERNNKRIRAFDRIKKFRESRHYEEYSSQRYNEDESFDGKIELDKEEYKKIVGLLPRKEID